MNDTLSLVVTLTPAAQEVLRRVGGWSSSLLPAVARGLDLGMEQALGAIQRTRFSGKGPFDPAEHRLGVKTSRLRSSLRRSKARIEGGAVTAGIGSNVRYFGIHEFGGQIKHPARSGSVRLRLNKDNTLMRQGGHPNLARFASNGHSRATSVAFTSKGHTQTMPERAPLRTGMREQLQTISLGISRSIVRAFKEGDLS